jgi:hypothetical protein
MPKIERQIRIKGHIMGRVFKNVVRGFSLVLHDPKGSHYKIWRSRSSGIAETNLNPKLAQD